MISSCEFSRENFSEKILGNQGKYLITHRHQAAGAFTSNQSTKANPWKNDSFLKIINPFHFTARFISIR